MVYGGLYHSIIKRACDKGAISINCINIRDFAGNKHNSVDDYPYGGGLGMVMQPEPVYAACKSVGAAEGTRVVYMTPQGRRFDRNIAEEFSKEKELILLCGHYEGIDERVIEEIVTDEISVGDYILTGGELAAMVVIDSVARLVPNVLGKDESSLDESFADNLLEYPQYTRPLFWRGKEVPRILLSGHHKKVDKWRAEQRMLRTEKKRPDLFNKRKE